MRSQRVAGGGGGDDDDARTDLEERESGRRESDVAGLEGYLFGGRRHGREGTSKQEGLVKTFFFLEQRDG